MPFVTKISFSSGDRDVLAETVKNIKTLLDKKGGEYDGPHALPAETVTVPLYQQLRVGKKFPSWEYTVHKRVIQIHGSNNIARELLAEDFPDSHHVEVAIGKEGEMDDMEHQISSKPTDSQGATQSEGVDGMSTNQDGEQRGVNVGADQNQSERELYAELEVLREQAVEDAVESVPDNNTPTAPQARQYTRSTAVREYVMSRASGECEGCGEPAPFTSKTGEPYLHGHHTDELSDGGSDKPASVIALCPNCHYRVHHGEDGAEYNRQLKTHVEKIEIHLDG